MKHTTVSAGHLTYAAAFEVAAKLVGAKRKDSWRGRVRIRYRRVTDTFDVQVPAPVQASTQEAATRVRLLVDG